MTGRREHYVALFDSLFLPQALALHKSLLRVASDATLWFLCLDDEALNLVAKLGLPNVRALALSELETEGLRRVKTQRSIAEYCWTLTPFAPRFVFEADESVDRVTYLDVDLWFLRSPRSIFAEFEASKKDVLITSHAYAPEVDQGSSTGRYCVQFMTFTRQGETVRQWWEERCLEWCFARHEDGKFGDQKYLDDWPERFQQHVHVLQREEAALAPWNAARFPASSAVFFHFHRLRILGRKRIEASRGYDIPRATFLTVYKPYALEIFEAIDTLLAYGWRFRPQAKPSSVYHSLGVLYKRWRRAAFAAKTVHRLGR